MNQSPNNVYICSMEFCQQSYIKSAASIKLFSCSGLSVSQQWRGCCQFEPIGLNAYLSYHIETRPAPLTHDASKLTWHAKNAFDLCATRQCGVSAGDLLSDKVTCHFVTLALFFQGNLSFIVHYYRLVYICHFYLQFSTLQTLALAMNIVHCKQTKACYIDKRNFNFSAVSSIAKCGILCSIVFCGKRQLTFVQVTSIAYGAIFDAFWRHKFVLLCPYRTGISAAWFSWTT